MRTERRHELATNTLAKDLEIGYEKVKPYTQQALLGVGAVLVLFGAWSFYRNSQAQMDQTAWQALETATLTGDHELEGVEEIIDDEAFAGRSAQEWAAIGWADRQLRIASTEYLLMRDDADKRLEGVAGLYRQYASSAASEEVRNRARLGIARIHELRGEIDDALAAYGLVNGELKEIAEDRIASLSNPEGVEAVKWLTTAKVKLPTAPKGPGTPGARPNFSPGEPAADGEMELNSTRTLEDIIEGLQDSVESQGDSDRYKDGAAEAQGDAADAATEEPEQDAPPADSSDAKE